MQGLRIKPFRNCALKRATDDQLVKLTAYLIGIKDLTDFSSLNHDVLFSSISFIHAY